MTRFQLETWKQTPLAVNTQPDNSQVGNREVQDMAVRAGCWLRSDSIIGEEPIQIEELANRPPWLPVIMEDGGNRHHLLTCRVTPQAQGRRRVQGESRPPRARSGGQLLGLVDRSRQPAAVLREIPARVRRAAAADGLPGPPVMDLAAAALRHQCNWWLRGQRRGGRSSRRAAGLPGEPGRQNQESAAAWMRGTPTEASCGSALSSCRRAIRPRR